MKKQIHYRQGQLHCVQLDDNTVALVLPTEYAAAIRDLIHSGASGSHWFSRLKWLAMVSSAISNLKYFPEVVRDDIAGEVRFKDNPAVQ